MADQPTLHLPENRLDPRIKNVWRISDALQVAVWGACVVVPLAVLSLAGEADIPVPLLAAFTAIWIAAFVLWIVVLPPIRYARWRYEVRNDYIDIMRGIIWRKRTIIPFIRVQNTDTRQGPILRAFGLASVAVSTAAGQHEIPGLDVQAAEQLRDRAAELARLAREDV